MAYYLIQYENNIYASSELYRDAVAGGEKSMIKMFAENKVSATHIFDQSVYAITAEQRDKCAEYGPTLQDFDAAYRNIHILSKESIRNILLHEEPGYPDTTVLTIPKDAAPELYRYRHAEFFRATQYRNSRKYALVPKMAAVRVGGRIYIAVNGVNVRVEAPIVVTISGK
jgi:hypothetical protein